MLFRKVIDSFPGIPPGKLDIVILKKKFNASSRSDFDDRTIQEDTADQ